MKNLKQPIYDPVFIAKNRAKHQVKHLWMHSMEKEIQYPNPVAGLAVLLIIGAAAAVIVGLMYLLIPGLI